MDSFYNWRKRQIETSIELLRDYGFVFVHGEEGCGKSVIINELIPRRLESNKNGFDHQEWIFTRMAPGTNALFNLSWQVVRSVDQGENIDLDVVKNLETDMESSNRGLEIFLENNNENRNHLLIVDDFEELIQLSQVSEKDNRDQINQFISNIFKVAEDKKIYLILGIRSNAINAFSEYPMFQEKISKSQFAINDLEESGLKEAISSFGLEDEIKSEDAVFLEILNQVGDCQLPFLNPFLKELKTRNIGRQEVENYLPIYRFEKENFSQRFHDLENEEQQIIKKLVQLFFTHKTNGGLEPIYSKKELVKYIGSDIEKIMETMVAYDPHSFLFIRKTNIYGAHAIKGKESDQVRSETIKLRFLRHSFLIDQITNWLEEENKNKSNYLQLCDLSESYENERGNLLKSPELEYFLAWQEQNKLERQWLLRYRDDFDKAFNYLEKSKFEDNQEKKRKKLELENEKNKNRKRIRGLLLLVSFALVAAVVAFIKGEEARKSRNEATASLDFAEYKAEQARIAKDSSIAARYLADEKTEEARKSEKEAKKAEKSAEESKIEAEKAELQARFNLIKAQEERKRAESNERRADKERKKAEKNEKEAKKLKRIASIEAKLLQLSNQLKIADINDKKGIEFYVQQVVDSADQLRKTQNELKQENPEEYANLNLSQLQPIFQTSFEKINGKNKYIDTKMNLLSTSNGSKTKYNGNLRDIDINQRGNAVSVGNKGVVYFAENMTFKTPGRNILPVHRVSNANNLVDLRSCKLLPNGNVALGGVSAGEAFLAIFDPSQKTSKRIAFEAEKNDIVKDFFIIGKTIIARGLNTFYFFQIPNLLKAKDPLMFNHKIQTVFQFQDQIFFVINGQLKTLDENGSQSTFFLKNIESSSSIFVDDRWVILGTQKGRLKVFKRNGKELVEKVDMNAHNSAITSLAYLPESSYLVTSSLDNEVKVFSMNKNNSSLKKLNQISSLEGHEKWVWKMVKAEIGSGHFLVSIDEGGNALAWYSDSDELLDELRKKVN
ncbi:MAG: NB-ARC domain-containing protein [Bacteroidota bacterium]|nr:NB-ARC domain-containing protein [Bacteroidota bacterium]